MVIIWVNTKDYVLNFWFPVPLVRSLDIASLSYQKVKNWTDWKISNYSWNLKLWEDTVKPLLPRLKRQANTGSYRLSKVETQDQKPLGELVLDQENLNWLRNCWRLSVEVWESKTPGGHSHEGPWQYWEIYLQELSWISTVNTEKSPLVLVVGWGGKGMILKYITAFCAS